MHTKPFVAQADRLGQHLTRSLGAEPPRATILEAVAAMHGAASWKALNRPKAPRGLCRLLHLQPQQPVSVVEDFDEMLASLSDEGLRLGLLNGDQPGALELSDGILTRHLLITSANGFGGRVMLEHLIVQQVLRGGGLLLADGLDDPGMARMLESAARFAGRSGALRPLTGETDDGVLLDLAARGSLGYCRVSFTNGGADVAAIRREAMCQILDRFWQQVGILAERGHRPAVPFLLIVPAASGVLDATWAARFSQARGLGIAIVLQEQSLAPLTQATGGVLEHVLGNTFTKVFFNQMSSTAVDLATTCVAGQVPGATHEEARQRLIALGMGDALVVTGGDLHCVHACMVKHPRQWEKPA